jgi:hypothetical protein
MWVMEIPSLVISKIKNEFPEEKKTQYGMNDQKNFSTVPSSSNNPYFPFVFLKLLPGVEVGQDLEGLDINGGNFTFQVTVTDNKSQNRAKDVMSEVMKIMKNMRFRVSAMPEFEGEGNTHICIVRFSRIIGADDKI